jgi:hypothetical protein
MKRAPSLAAAVRRMESELRQPRFAAIGALNDTAFEATVAVQRAMAAVFDRPRPETIKSIVYDQAGANGPTRKANRVERRFGSPARIANPGPGYQTRIYVSDYIYEAEKRALAPEVFGGTRGYKGAERRLQQMGLMPPGHFMVPSRELLSQGQLVDAYGNVKGSFIRGLLSYLQAFNDAGYTANTSKRSRDRIAARGRNERGFATINGVVDFASGDPRAPAHGGRTGNLDRKQHLAPGIWAKRGVGGARVYPVFLFVPGANYRVRLRFEDIVRNVAERSFPRFFAERLQRALATAR